MKCFACDGTGMCHDEEMRFDCPVCHGTGEYLPTNEEWFCGLSTEEKAQNLASWFRKTIWSMQQNKDVYDLSNDKFWQEWLKQPHTDKEVKK